MPYVVTSPFDRFGKRHNVGEPFEPMPHEIGQLVASGCIKEVQPCMDAPTGYVPPKVGALVVDAEAKTATKPSQSATFVSRKD